MPLSVTDAIRHAYAAMPQAVEPILTTAALRAEFLGRVQQLWPDADEDEVLQHLVLLRKRGADKGGLSRKNR